MGEFYAETYEYLMGMGEGRRKKKILYVVHLSGLIPPVVVHTCAQWSRLLCIHHWKVQDAYRPKPRIWLWKGPVCLLGKRKNCRLRIC